MTTSQVTMKALAAFTLLVGFATAANAQPAPVSADWAIKQMPRQPGVNVSTPAANQIANCKVSAIPNDKAPGKSMGAIVTDPDGKPVRQFVSYDDKNFNIVVYFLDGAEAYREVYPPQANEPFQFRWLGPNGSKWGLDRNRDGVIDEWVVISPEEASQEILQAVITNDPKRIAALTVTKENLSALGLPPADVAKIQARTAGAAKRVTDAAAALKLSDKAKWIHAEFGIPQTRPGDSFGGTQDYTAYKNGAVWIEEGGKTQVLQTGELVQIGRAWKLVDGPSAGPVPVGGGSDPQANQVTPEIKELVDKLNELDKTPPAQPTIAAIAAFNSRRADILEQIVAKLPEDKKESWAKMLLESHATAAEGDKPGNKHIVRLGEWKVAMSKPNGNATLAAYAAFRLLIAENSIALANIKDGATELKPIQDKWRAGLEEFVKAYPQSADTAEALLRLATAYEHSEGKDAEANARKWFDTLAKNFATTPQGAKAAGAIKRLDSEGKPLELSGPVLGTNQQFNAGGQAGKVVVVYYWASWSSTLAEDAKKLQTLITNYEKKGLVLVTVSVDHDPKQATEAAQRSALPGTALYAEGGLDRSPLAATYGILAPPYIMVAGKDGKVTNRNANLATLEDELKKLMP